MISKFQSRRLIRHFFAYAAVGLFACIAASIILFQIPADPKNAWLLGLSKSRWLMIASVVFIGAIYAFALIKLISSVRQKKFEKYVERFRSYRYHIAIIWILFFLLLFIFIGIFFFHRFVNIQESVVITRLATLIVLSEFLIIKTIAFLVAVHLPLTGQSITEGFATFFSFPAKVFNNIFQFIENLFDRLAEKSNRRVLIGLILLTPFLMTSAIVWFSFDTTLSTYMPTGSDEMVYWREILTFTATGFDGGQYSTDELIAEVKWSRFEAHGPAFPVLYGSLGRIFGWALNTGVIFNHIFMTLALLGYIYLSRPSKKQLAFLWLTAVTFWPIWFYMPTTRIEGLFFPFAIALAGLLVRLIDHPKKNVWLYVVITLLIFVASLMRASWSFLFISFIGVLLANYSWKGLAKTALIAIIPIGILLVYFRLVLAPYPSIAYNSIRALAVGDLAQVVPVIENAYINTRSFFSTKDNQLLVLFRYQLLWVLIVSIIDFFMSGQDHAPSKSPKEKFISYFNASNLGLVLIFNLIIWNVHAGREFRVWSPHLLLTLLVLIFSARKRLVTGIILSNLLFVVAFGNHFYAARNQNFLGDNADIDEIRAAISPYVKYEPVDNHWCNTISVSRYSSEITWGPWMLYLPEEFGVTSILHWDEFYKKPLRAKFVLLDAEYIGEKYPKLFDRTDLAPITETPIGTLYYNRESDCPPP